MSVMAGGFSWLAFAGSGIRLAELHSLFQNAGNAGRVPHDPLGDTHTSLYLMVLAGWRAVVTLFLGFQGSAVITFIAAAWPLAVLGVFCALSPASKPSRLALGLAAVALGPLALLAVASLLITPMPLSQYSAIIVPTLYALVARAVCFCEWPYSFLAKSGLLVVMLLALARQAFQPNLAIKQDYRDLSQYLSGG
jgi:hypothetical protein